METKQYKSGKIKYREKIYIEGKALTSPYFTRKTDAKSWKQNKLYEREKMAALGIDYIKDITIQEYSEIYIHNKSTLEKRTIESYKNILSKYIIPLFGSKDLKQIRYSDADYLKAILNKKGLSVKRMNNVLKCFKMLLSQAVKNDYLLKSPLINFSLIKEQERTLAYWLPKEIMRFLKSNSTNHYLPLYVTALNTGMRKGELCGLCWDGVDFTNRQIIVKRSFSREGLKESTKSHKIRIIPMNESVYSCLLDLSKNKASLEYVFTTPKGQHISYEHFTCREFNKAIERANVKHIRFHDLRTTYASNFCMNGGDIFSLSKILGHSSVEITQKSYAHLHPEFIKKQASVVEFNIFNSPDLAPDKIEHIGNVLKINS